ncbi:MAG: preprotein translocase subunit SecG [candidate division Zixibacteria bacterium HGW-Zixibacteria-1]|nr:MAG: preprotein translocase subunit SecG [candidate division Zixibacteria bacterium HGW-Zixibacteria-1]
MVVFHTLVCILLMIVVLMQSAKGEGLAGAFGGGGTGLTGAVFGGRGAASFLSKATTILAVVFIINCGVLAFMSSHRSGRGAGAATGGSVVTEEAQRELERQSAQQQALPVDNQGGTQPADQNTGDGELPAVPAQNETGQ